MEKEVDRGLIESYKGKHKVLELGRNNPSHQYRLGVDQLQCNFTEKDFGALVGLSHKPAMRPHGKKGQQYSGLY